MAEVFRRVILKPAGAPSAALAQFAKSLFEVVEAQKLLAAQSLHVLRPISALQQDDRSFFVDYEPALPVGEPEALFDPEQPGTAAGELLRITAAIFDVLRAAHGGEVPGARVHGGLCPAVLLRTADGIDKIADVGLAPALCAVFGVDSYLNLAVSARATSASGEHRTGVWEVLTPDEFQRDDRICSFIDPEKYRTQAMTGFEPGSDVIAAGFVIHLLAEHAHPYLPDPDAHRMLDMAEFMAQTRYNGARRPDLRNSAEPGVQQWCGLVERMLANIPRERPTAAAVCEALAPFVKPVDAGDLLGRQFEAIEQRLRSTPPEQIDWATERAALTSLAKQQACPAELAAKAEAAAQAIDAQVFLAEAERLLETDEWAAARETIDGLRGLKGLPADAAQRAERAVALFDRRLDLERDLAAIESEAGETKSLEELPSHLAHLGQRLHRLDMKGAAPTKDITATAARLQALIKEKSDHAARQLAERDQKKRAEAERLAQERAADEATFRGWATDIEAARQAGEWSMFAELLDAPPALLHVPADFEAAVAEMRRKLDEHNRAAQLEAERRAAHEQAVAWSAQLSKAVEGANWDQLEKLLAKRPELAHWPPEATTEEGRCRGLLQDVRKRQREAQLAREWMTQLRAAAGKKEWSRTADLLGKKPVVEEWPADFAREEAAIRAEVNQHLEAIERERREIAEDERAAAQWLARAEKLAASEQWDQAIAVLDAPPQLKHPPTGMNAQAAAMRKNYAAQHEEQLRRELDRHVALVRTQSEDLFRGVVRKRYAAFLSDEGIRAIIDPVKFSTLPLFTAGSAKLTMTAEHQGKPLGKSLEEAFDFELGKQGVALAAASKALLSRIEEYFQGVLLVRQKEQATAVVGPLRTGLFPHAEVESKFVALVERWSTTLALLGAAQAEGRVEAAFTWNTATLTWDIVGASAVVRAALDVVVKAVQKTALGAVLGAAAPLTAYQQFVSVSVPVPKVDQFAALCGPLNVVLHVTFTLPQSAPVALGTVPATCNRWDRLALSGDASAVIAAFQEFLLKAQGGARDRLLEPLQARLASAPVKARLAVEPARLSAPVPGIGITLSVRKRESVVLKAAWNTTTLTFDAGKDWDAGLERILAPPAPGEQRGRLIVPIGVAATLLLAGGVGYGIWAGKDSGSAVPPAQVAVPTDPVEQPPRLDPGGRVAEVPNENDNVPGTNHVANLNDNDNVVEYNSEPEPPGVPATVVDAGEQPVAVAFTPPAPEQLEAALETTFEKALQAFDQTMIDPSRLTVHAPPPTEWTERNGGHVAGGVTARVGIPGAEGRSEIEVASYAVEFEAGEDGVVVRALDPDLVKSLNASLNAVLLETQAVASERRRASIANAFPGETEVRLVAAGQSPDGPPSAPTVVIAAPGLLERQVALQWDREALEFVIAPEGQALLDDAQWALGFFTALSRSASSLPDDHWFRAALSDSATVFFHEVTPLDAEADEWTIAMPAPWASAAAAPTPANERLPFTLSVAQLGRQAEPGPQAQRFLTEMLTVPDYWPIVKEYDRLKDAGGLVRLSDLSDEEVADLLATARIDAAARSVFSRDVMPFIRSDALIVLLTRVDFSQVAVRYQEDVPVELTTPVSVAWAADPRHEAWPAALPAQRSERVDQIVRSLLGAPAATRTLTIAAGDQQFTWVGAEVIISNLIDTVDKVAALDTRLRAYGAREAFEREVLQLLPVGQSVLDLSARREDALAILQRMLTLKGSDARPTGFVELTEALQRNQSRVKRAFIVPTVAAEYCCGTVDCYALAWSMANPRSTQPGFAEGPILLRVGPTAKVVAAEIDLLAPVLAALPDAARADRTRFEYVLGVAAGIDDQFTAGEVLADATIAPQSSTLGTVDFRSATKSWNSLADLRSPEFRDYLSDYWIVRSLADFGPPLPANFWSAEVLYAESAPPP